MNAGPQTLDAVLNFARANPDRLDAEFAAPVLLVVAVGKNPKLPVNKLSFGRSTICDVVLPFSAISKHHGYFENAGATWLVTDVGSTNGTQVNGRSAAKGQKVPLDDGATLQMGKVSARFVPDGPGERREVLRVVGSGGARRGTAVFAGPMAGVQHRHGVADVPPQLSPASCPAEQVRDLHVGRKVPRERRQRALAPVEGGALVLEHHVERDQLGEGLEVPALFQSLERGVALAGDRRARWRVLVQQLEEHQRHDAVLHQVEGRVEVGAVSPQPQALLERGLELPRGEQLPDSRQ